MNKTDRINQITLKQKITTSHKKEELLAKHILRVFDSKGAISTSDFVHRACGHAKVFAHRIGPSVKLDLGLLDINSTSESNSEHASGIRRLGGQISLYLLLEAHGMGKCISIPGLASLLCANRIKLAEFQIQHALNKRINEIRDSTWWLVTASFSSQNRETIIFRVSDPEDRVQYTIELVLSEDYLELDALRTMPLPGLSDSQRICELSTVRSSITIAFLSNITSIIIDNRSEHPHQFRVLARLASRLRFHVDFEEGSRKLMLSETEDFVRTLSDMMDTADLPFFTNITTRTLTLTVPLKEREKTSSVTPALSTFNVKTQSFLLCFWLPAWPNSLSYTNNFFLVGTRQEF